jgi:hypothetical protein
VDTSDATSTGTPATAAAAGAGRALDLEASPALELLVAHHLEVLEQLGALAGRLEQLEAQSAGTLARILGRLDDLHTDAQQLGAAVAWCVQSVNELKAGGLSSLIRGRRNGN